MNIDWTPLSGNGSIQRFTNALQVAIHDKKCEEYGQLEFFYDTGVVARMISGFEQFHNERTPNKDSRNLLVRSLLSSGLLGKVALLRPHALELHQVLSRKESFRSERARGAFRTRLKKFLENQGVADLFADLAATTRRRDADSVQHFLSRMQQIAPSSFVYIELANGSWQQRLTRLHKMGILKFEGDSHELREALHDPIIWKFKDMIEARIKRLDQTLSLRRLRDATALAILHQMIRRFQAGEKVPQVRFFTEATFLNKAWEKNPDMAQLLSYSDLGGGGKSKDLFIVRDADYFILRAAFEALSFPKKNEPMKEPIVSLEELQKVSNELEAIADKAHSEVEDYLNSRKLGPRLLAEHLQGFSSLSFLNTIWRSYKLPSLISELVDGLGEVWNFGHDAQTEEALHQKMRKGAEEIKGRLRATVREADTWFETLNNVRDRAMIVIPKSSVNSESPPNPGRDLGIVRWGLELSPDGEYAFRNFVSPFLSDDEQEWHQGCIDLTTAILDPGDDLDNCIVVCAILWWLNGFKTLGQTIDRAEAEFLKKGQAVPIGLSIMKAAALLQATSHSIPEKEKMIQAEVERVEVSTDAEKPRYYVGLSYLYYRAWSSETHDKKEEARGKNRPALDRWIYESYHLAEKAEGILSRDSLLWAFAVNICAYVGVAADIEPDKTDRYIRLLGDLEKRYTLWNYRFADTLSYYYLVLAEKKYKQQAEPKEICGLLRTSAFYLKDALKCFADPAIPAHRNQLIQLTSKVGCANVEIPEL